MKKIESFTLESGIQFTIRNGVFWKKRDPKVPLIVLWDVVSSDQYTVSRDFYDRKQGNFEVEFVFDQEKLRQLEVLFSQAEKAFSRYLNIRFVRYKNLLEPSSSLYDARMRIGLVENKKLNELNVAGYAILPGNKFSGDIMINKKYLPKFTTFSIFGTMVHEMGHALGLLHTHLTDSEIDKIVNKNSSKINEHTLAALEHILTFDSGDFSIMSYECESSSFRRDIGLGIIDYMALGRVYGYKPYVQQKINIGLNEFFHEQVAFDHEFNRGVIVPAGFNVIQYGRLDDGNRKTVQVSLATEPLVTYGQEKLARFMNVQHVQRLESYSRDHVKFYGSSKNEQFRGGMGHDQYYGRGGHDVIEVDLLQGGHDTIEDIHCENTKIDLVIENVPFKKLICFKDGYDLILGYSPIQIEGKRILGAGYLMDPKPDEHIRKDMIISVAECNRLKAIPISSWIKYIVLAAPKGKCVGVKLPEDTIECMVLVGKKDEWTNFLRYKDYRTQMVRLKSKKTNKEFNFYYDSGASVKFTLISKEDIYKSIFDNMTSSMTIKNGLAFFERVKIFMNDMGQRRLINLMKIKCYDKPKTSTLNFF